VGLVTVGPRKNIETLGITDLLLLPDATWGVLYFARLVVLIYVQ